MSSFKASKRSTRFSGRPKSARSSSSRPQVKAAGPRELLAWALRWRRRYSVTGRSMLPMLAPMDQVLAKPVRGGDVKPDDVVVVAHPRQPSLKLVKRVDQVFPDGRLVVLGLNDAESTDSRSFGPLPPEAVLGKVTSVFR